MGPIPNPQKKFSKYSDNYYENKIIMNNANIHRTNTHMAQPKSHMLTQQHAEIKRKKAFKDNAFEDINNNQNIKKNSHIFLLM